MCTLLWIMTVAFYGHALDFVFSPQQPSTWGVPPHRKHVPKWAGTHVGPMRLGQMSQAQIGLCRPVWELFQCGQLHPQASTGSQKCLVQGRTTFLFVISVSRMSPGCRDFWAQRGRPRSDHEVVTQWTRGGRKVDTGECEMGMRLSQCCLRLAGCKVVMIWPRGHSHSHKQNGNTARALSISDTLVLITLLLKSSQVGCESFGHEVTMKCSLFWPSKLVYYVPLFATSCYYSPDDTTFRFLKLFETIRSRNRYVC